MHSGSGIVEHKASQWHHRSLAG